MKLLQTNYVKLLNSLNSEVTNFVAAKGCTVLSLGANFCSQHLCLPLGGPTKDAGKVCFQHFQRTTKSSNFTNRFKQLHVCVNTNKKNSINLPNATG